MKATCPNKSGALYKELMSLNNNDEGLATYAHNIITDLQDKKLITINKFKTNKGEFIYKIPKISGIRDKYQLNYKAQEILDDIIKNNNISFISTRESNSKDYIIVNISSVKNNIVNNSYNKFKQNKVQEVLDLNEFNLTNTKLRKKNPLIQVNNNVSFDSKGIKLTSKTDNTGRTFLYKDSKGYYKGFVEEGSEAFYQYFDELDFKNPIILKGYKSKHYFLSDRIRIENIEQKVKRLKQREQEIKLLKEGKFLIKPAKTDRSNKAAVAKETARLKEINDLFLKKENALQNVQNQITEVANQRSTLLENLEKTIDNKLEQDNNLETKDFLIKKILKSISSVTENDIVAYETLGKLPFPVLSRLVFNIENYQDDNYSGSYILTDDKVNITEDLEFYSDELLEHLQNSYNPSTNYIIGQLRNKYQAAYDFAIKNNYTKESINQYKYILSAVDKAVESLNEKILNDDLKETFNKEELILLDDFIKNIRKPSQQKKVSNYISRLGGKKSKFSALLVEGLKQSDLSFINWTELALAYLNTYKNTVDQNRKDIRSNNSELENLFNYHESVNYLNKLIKDKNKENIAVLTKKAYIDLNSNRANFNTVLHEIGHFVYDIGKDLKSYKNIEDLTKKLYESSDKFKNYVEELKTFYKDKLTEDEYNNYNFNSEIFANIYDAVLSKEGELYKILEDSKIVENISFIKKLTQAILDFLKDVINFNTYGNEFSKLIEELHSELEDYKQAEIEINNNKFEYKLFNEQYVDIEKEIEEIKQDFINKKIIIEIKEAKDDPDFLLDSFNTIKKVYSDETKKHESMLYNRLMNHFSDEDALHIFLLTHTKNFKKWFEGTSRVYRNELGEPELYFHGSGSAYYEISKEKFKSGEGAMAYGAGLYLTDWFDTSVSYSSGATSKTNNVKYKDVFKKLFNKKAINKEDNPFIHELFINVKNPLFLDGSISERIKNIIKEKLNFIKFTDNPELKNDNSYGNFNYRKENGIYYVHNKLNGTLFYQIIQDHLFGDPLDTRLDFRINDTSTSPEASEFLFNLGIGSNYRFAGGATNAFGGQHKRGEMHTIVFDSSNLKSVNNIGTFNPESSNKYYNFDQPASAIPLRKQDKDGNVIEDNTSLYKKYNLLSDKNEIKLFSESDAKRISKKLNESPYYTFLPRNTPSGIRIIIFPKQLTSNKYYSFKKSDKDVLNVQDSNLNSLESGKKTISIRPKEEKQESAFTKIEIYFANRIKRLTKELEKLEEGTTKYDNLKKELDTLKEKFNTAKTLQSKDLFKELGEEVLNKVDEFITQLEDGLLEDDAKKIEHSIEVINTFSEFTGLRDTSYQLLDRLKPFIDNLKVELVQEFATEKVKPSLEDIENQDTDISKRISGTGSLSDLANYVGRTIGSLIKSVQNKVETYTKKSKNEIEKEVKALNDYAKKNGATLEDTYKLFVQESNGTLKLVQPYLDNGEENPNWDKILNTPELIEFYNFYVKKIEEAQDGLPIKFGKSFIPNIRKTDFKSKIKSLSIIKERTIKEGFEEENLADIVPLQYHKSIPASEKSTDLGTILFEFGKFAYNQKEMTNILPKLRLLQESLTYKIVNGNYVERQFRTANNPSLTIPGNKTNLYNMINKIIDMQVKGNMKLDEFQFVTSETTDADGNTVQTIVDGSKALDLLLKFNSLLRIGLSPITSFTNWLFGDISNTIEAVGGQYFNLKQLHEASKIFFKQNFDRDSVMNKLLEELNPLQELMDYSLKSDIEQIGNTKLTTDKVQEIMYSMQTTGEKFLQSRTLLAVMINEGYLTSNGELTDKYNKIDSKEKQQLVDKVQRLNQKIHGRYSVKEAATLHQNVLFRLVSQFRKWIFTAVENRINQEQYDNRLQQTIEGSYRTFGRLVLKNWKNPKQAFENLLLPLINGKKLLEEGKLEEFEIYNMRKMAIELITIGSLAMLYAFVHGGDDDKDRRKLPAIKLVLTLLDRASGDLTFFYSPEQINQLGKNAIPLSKTFGDILDAMFIVPKVLYTGDYTIKKGSSKGRNRIVKEFSDITPLAKPAFELYKIGRRDVSLEEQRN